MGSVPNFCSQCGASLSPGDAFCSQCGTSVDDGDSSRWTAESGRTGRTGRTGGTGRTGRTSGAERTDRPDTAGRTDFRRRIENLTMEGWEVEHDYGDRVVLVDRGLGSVGVHVLLFVFTWGFANLLYAVYSYSMGADRVELRADGTHQYLSGGPEGADDASDADDLTAGSVVISFFLALIGFAIVGGGASSVAGFFVGLSFLAGALYAFPPMRRRLRERESVTSFGWRRSTDEVVVDLPDTPCTACSRPIGTGVARTFHETFYVAGIPITRDEKGTNGYCQSCAQGDPFTESDVDTGEREAEIEY